MTLVVTRDYVSSMDIAKVLIGAIGATTPHASRLKEMLN